MSTFVLVHGAWHGGWCWSRVAARLRAAGHAVFTPTLTGLGERSHLLGPMNDVNLHVEDVLQVLKYEDLRDVVLCGHSYAGIVVTGVASRAGNRVGALVYLDAYVPQDGQCGLDLRPPALNLALLDQVRRDGAGWRMPPPPAEAFRVQTEEDRRWVDAHLTEMALRCYTEPVRLGPDRPEVPTLYARAADYPNESFDRTVATAPSEWTTCRIPGGHDLMVDSPDEVATRLLGIQTGKM